MKRVFTLLVALGLLTAADAQRGVNTTRGRVGVNVSISGNNGYQQSRFAADRMLREQVFRINQNYDHKIRQVKFSRYMRNSEKIRKIRKLEQQRQREINRAYTNARYNDNRYDNRNRRY
jgi:hypothetical protein